MLSTLYLTLGIYVLLLILALWRVWRGENAIDRLIGVDLVTVLTLGILVILALIYRDSIFIDVALGLAALGFITTIALAKHIADEQMF
ncbi:MAG: cation:proton antiporter [Caldilineales bacterium]|nr:cation:proton antiporter [Caldilineales bacterium]